MTTSFKRKISDRLIVIANQKLKERDYWLKKLSGQLEKCYMPYDRLPVGRHDSDALHDKPGHEYRQVHFNIEGEPRERLLKLSNNADFRLHMIFAALLVILLHKYTGGTDIIVGSPIYKQEADIEFINTILPLRNQINNHMKFKELLQQARQVIMEATENQNYPMEVLLEQLNLSEPADQEKDFPLFDVTILIENIHDKKYLQHIRTNLIFSFLRKEHSIRGLVEYDPLRYKNSRIKRMVGHYENLLKNVIFNVNLSINNIDLLLEAEKKQLLNDFNRVEKKSQPNPHRLQAVTIHEIFENQVEKTPNHVALLFENYNITYRMLNHRANQAASAIRTKGVKPDAIVALMVEPSIEMAVGILAVLKAGGAYLPIDLDYPASRIKYMLNDSGANVLLTTQKSDNTGLVKKQINLDNKELHQGNTQNIPNINHPGNIAYVIYTSGTTGKPKGVMVEHRNVIAYLLAFYNEFQISAKDIMIQNASYCFDVFVEEFYPVLFKGGKIAIASVYEGMDIFLLYSNIIKNCVTIVDFTPLLLNELNRFDHLGGIRYFISGGDVLKAGYVENLLKSGCTYNTYGPTETTVCSSYFKCPPAVEANIPIGKPILNYKIYIWDKNNRPVPIGIPGEICVSGKGVSRGYLNKPDLTNEKFITPPLEKNGRIYKTGDLGAWLENGNMEFLGRVDQQVNIRGYRIELGEIESKLLKHKDIKEAVVVDKANQDGEKELYAYFVSRQEINPLDLRQFLVSELPNYMIPSFFIPIECIPLTTNGKLNRKALPELVIKTGKKYVTPRNRTEEILVDIWAEVLKVDQNVVGIDTNFFELGGHSLKAIIMTSRIHKELNVKIPLAEVFNLQTIREISTYIEIAVKNQYISIKPVEKKECYPLSSAQKRLYILQQMSLDSIAYNMSHTIPLREEPDINKLEQTFIQLIQRHESLRTSFHLVQDEPAQKIHALEEVEFQIRLYHSYTRRQWVQPFDLAKAPLLRVGLTVREDNRHLLMLDMHHIISDGVSHQILEQDFMSLYNAEPLPPLGLRYKDYAEWQNSIKQQSLLKSQESFWMNVFSDELPILNLPIDYPRPLVQSFEGSSVNFSITHKETQTLKNIAAKAEATLYMVILSIYTILLFKLSIQEDIIVGTPIATRRHVDLESIVGMFVNTITMRNFPAAEKTFELFLTEVKQRAVNAFENQEYQFEDLVDQLSLRRDTSRNPIFDVMFNLLNQLDFQGNVTEFAEQDSNPDQLDSNYEHRSGTSKFDLNLTAWDMGQKLFFNLEYSTRLFKAKTIEKIIGYFRKIISVLSLYINRLSELKISEIEILSAVEKEEILDMSSGVEEPVAENKTLHQWFESQAAKTPDKIAVVGAGLGSSPPHANAAELSLTYKELNCKANQLVNTLRKKGIGPDSLVGLMVERSFEMIMAILGILKAGGAYLPIDTQYPAERKKYLLHDCDVKLLLTNYEMNNDVDYVPGNLEVVNASEKNIYVGSFKNPENMSMSSDLVYVIYTSGSTGKPNGVMIEHQNLVNLFKFHFKYTNLSSSKVLQFATISFDASFHEIFSTLLSGGELYLVDNETRTSAADLFNMIETHRISTLFLPMSFLRMIFDEDDYIQQIPGSIRHIQTAGEQVVISNRFKEYLKKNNVFLHNHYGPSETHVVTTLTLEPCGDIPELPSIGKPILNTDIYILDKAMQLMPVGVPGELFIGGLQVGRGYLNNPGLTFERFINYKQKINKKLLGGVQGGGFLEKSPPGRRRQGLYRSGDLSRWLADGNIEFLGRIDHQVKIRGFRVELREIETRLRHHDAVKEVLVTVKIDQQGDKQLCVYIVSDQQKNETVPSELREYLSNQLPDYMIPSYFVALEEFPLTHSGKINRSALPEPRIVYGKTYAAPRNELERKLAEVWSEVLGLDKEKISIDTNFFELGGHSLKATILAAKMHKVLEVKIPLVEIFRTPTIRSLAEYIKESAKNKYASLEIVEKKEYYDLSSAQKRLFIQQHMEKNYLGYNMPMAVMMEGKIETEKVEASFASLIKRHENLRTSFKMTGEGPIQKIYDDVEFTVAYHERIEEEAEELIKSFVRPFDLSRIPLLRVILVKVGDTRHILMVDIHHIITDGTSTGILVREFMALYGGKKLPPLQMQYKDFSEWQNHREGIETIRKQKEYWLEVFAGSAPVLNLPLDYQRPEIQNSEGNNIRFEIDSEDTKSMQKMALAEGATLYMVLMAVLNVLFAKECDQEDILIGVPIAGRRHADLEYIIGFFVNMLALRNFPTGEKTFREFLLEVKENTLKAYENQDYQFENLVDNLQANRNSGANSLIDAVFVFQNMEIMGNQIPEAEIPGLKLKSYGKARRYSPFDLVLNGQEVGGKLFFSFLYRTKLFKEETIRMFFRNFKEVVSTVLDNKNIRLKNIKISHDLLIVKPISLQEDVGDFKF